MQTVRLYSDSLEGRFIAQATEALREGDLIIIPTGTFYALSCDALNQRAIERLCRIKGINPDKNLLSVICSDISQAAEYARIDNKAFRILKEYLPGPFTFILPASTKLPKVFKGRKTVGIRIPDSAVARALAKSLGNPLLATSVNTNDEDDEYTFEPSIAAEKYEYDAFMIIDSGDGSIEPSTIVDLTDPSEPEIIRQGSGIFNG